MFQKIPQAIEHGVHCPIPKKVLVCAIISLCASSAQELLAQEAPSAGALQRELELQLERSQPLTPVAPKKQTAPRQAKPGEQTLDIKGFRFVGNTLVSNEQLQLLVKPWVDQTIPFSALNDITAAIQEYYFSVGRLVYVTVPPQEVKDGILELRIVEGKMGKVSVRQANPEKPVRFSTERAGLFVSQGNEGGQFIDTKALERGTTLLNEVPGVRVSGSFQAGQNEGESDYDAQIEETPLLVGQLAASNYGSSSTGSGQAIANLSLNNLSGIGDQVTLDAIASLGSGFAQAAYNLPVGVSGWKAGVQASYLHYKTLPSWSTTQTQGSANTVNANVNYALQRSQAANANVRLAIENRYYNNTQNAITISDYNINAISAALNGNWAYSASNTINYGATVTLGHLGISNLTQAGQDTTGPGTAGNYQKLALNFSHNQELTVLPNTSWLNAVYGQLANKNLNSSEQIYMGGPYAVRAYPVAQGGGSQGAILTSELNHRINENWQAGAFADVGFVQQYVSLYPNWKGLTNANNNYQLGDAGITAKYAYKTFFVSAAAAFRIGNNPLYTSSGKQLNSDNAYKSVQGWIRASWSF